MSKPKIKSGNEMFIPVYREILSFSPLNDFVQSACVLSKTESAMILSSKRGIKQFDEPVQVIFV